MKATLEFNLPDDELDFEMASNGAKLYYAIERYDNFLRGKIKHGDLTDMEYDIYQKCRDELREIMTDSNISFR